MAAMELSVKQILKVITSKDDQVNTIALHELLNIIVQKMNISDEKITLDSLAAEQIKTLLKEPHSGEVTVLKNRIGVMENLLKVSQDRLRDMQCEVHELRRVQEEVKRVRNHEFLRKIMDECNKCRQDEAPEIPFCIDYADPFNELVLGLLSNKTFLVELMKRVSCPILDKVNNWENQLEIMGDLFQKFIDKAEHEFARVPTPDMNEKAIKKLRDEFEKFMKDFLGVVREVQDMLDAKLDKIHIPALKKFIIDEFQILYEEIDKLKKAEDCPDGLATSKSVLENLKCLTCAGFVCQRTKPSKLSFFRKSKGQPVIHKVGHMKVPKRTAGGSHTKTTADERIFRTINLADEFGVKVIKPKLALLQGKDGTFYRAEPDVPSCMCKKPKNP